MGKLRRNISIRTQKALCALSGNECAEPNCTVPVVVPATEKSDFHILGKICHIYALSQEGPRGKAGLIEEELNALENLIILCPNHHDLVDGQHESYPAVLLKGWKKAHEAKSLRRRSTTLNNVYSGSLHHSRFPTALVDQNIEVEVGLLRKSRFLVEFDEVDRTLTLARRLLEGDLYGGSAPVSSQALTWCARILSATDNLDKAEEFLETAKSLGADTRIVDALICSRKGDKCSALNSLIGIDSPDSLTAAFIVVAHHDGPQGAIDWLRTAGKNASDLDPDGKCILLTSLVRLGKWEVARETTNSLTESDFEEAPTLHYMVAMTYLLSTVPEERRDVVLNHVPFDAATFPLASDANAIDARRIARTHFINAAQAVQKLNYPSVAAMPDGYALWLELRDSEYIDDGKLRLEDRLSNLESALHFVPLGLQFDIRLDQAVVDKEIERHIARNGGITRDAAAARFALARAQKSPEDVANYVDRHYNTLSEYLDTKALRSLQVEMFSRAGRTERANECLKFLLEEGISETEESRHRTMIDKDEGRDTVKEQETQFKQTGSLTDLIDLANELRRKEEWEALCKYGEILFERTRSVHDAEGLVLALYNAKKFSRIVELVEADAEFIEQSASLHIFYCSSLYYEGELLRARDELAQLSILSEDVHYRALRTNIAIAIGDWDSLSEFVREEHLQIENRSARELIEAAQLSLYLSLQNTRDLLFAAAEKGIDDADILTTAYFLATKAGWENDSKIITWLHRASELSGDEGPIWRVRANDFLNVRPDWIRLGSEIRHQLHLGEIPMILVAEFFKRPLANQMLFPAYENLPKRDPRLMSCIPAYSGGRQPNKLDTRATVGMEYTTLLTLSFLNLLNTVLDALDTIYVPHSTLAWLFEEKQQVAFHQPSRIANAQYIRDLLAKGFLEEYSPTTTTDSGLAAEVGDGLAMLIAEAESNTDGDRKRIVVRSSPVHRIGSLLEEEVDLGEHAEVVSSCQAIVRTLRHKGQISSSDEQRALAYLQLKEKPWPNQPEISGELTLYLDDLAVAYFLHLGMLEALSAAGFRVIVSPSMTLEVDELITYERIPGLVNSAIDNIRSVVSQGIASEKFKVGKWRHFDEWEEEIKSDLHIANVLVLAEDCEGIIVDDRYLNQHPRIEYNGAHKPLFSTLDLLDALVSADLIAEFDRLEYRTKLRQAGYIFVPITEDELTHHLRTATSTDGRLNETLELRAIRENILLVRMGDWLQLPKEDLWLETMTKVSVNVLRNLWEAGNDISSAEARSNWILDQIDVRGWAHSFSPESRNDIVKTGRVGVIFMLLTSLDADVPLNMREAYWRWVEDSVLGPVKEQFPDLYALIVNIKRRLIEELADTNLPDEEQSEK